VNSLRRLVWSLGALVAIVVIGVIGYMVIEGWSFLDAIYMTVTTITTVGFREVHPLSDAGRIFSILIIIGGVGGALYVLTAIMRYILEGQFGITMGRRRMKTRIARLKNHFILCGYGRVGQEIAQVFSEEGIPFIIIDNDEETVAKAEEAGHLCLHADAASDETLKEAGRVISPHAIGGRRMAMLALRPAVVDFIDTVTYGRGRELQLENADVGSGSRLVGKTMQEARRQAGITILAMRKGSGKLIANPPEEEMIEDGDRLIVIGTKKRLAALESIFEGRRRRK